MTRQYYTRFRAMGSTFQIWLETANDGSTILQDVPGWVEDIEASLSRFRAESELSRLNAHSGQWQVVSDVLFDAVLAAMHGARLTNGLYNPLILPALIAAGYDRSFDILQDEDFPGSESEPSTWSAPDWQAIRIDVSRNAIKLPARTQIDLGGIGKGWTAEYVAERLEGFGPCLVDAGGDLVARGMPQTGSGWQVIVAEPGQQEQNLLAINLVDQAVTTSGTDYRRWRKNGVTQHHLIDPRTGRPADTDVLSATVIHRDAEMAEVYTKVLILLGSEAGLRWFGEQGTGSAMVVRNDKAVLATSDFEAFIVQTEPV